MKGIFAPKNLIHSSASEQIQADSYVSVCLTVYSRQEATRRQVCHALHMPCRLSIDFYCHRFTFQRTKAVVALWNTQDDYTSYKQKLIIIRLHSSPDPKVIQIVNQPTMVL